MLATRWEPRGMWSGRSKLFRKVRHKEIHDVQEPNSLKKTKRQHHGSP